MPNDNYSFVVIYRPMYPPLGGDFIAGIMQEDTALDWVQMNNRRSTLAFDWYKESFERWG